MDAVPSSLNKFGLNETFSSSVVARSPTVWVATHVEKDFTDLCLRLGKIGELFRL